MQRFFWTLNQNLERFAAGSKNRSMFHDNKRCWYEHCSSLTESSQFYKIKEGCTAGGRDWRELEGNTLCQACYDCFIIRGTLERAEKAPKRLSVDERRCWYEHCSSPTKSSRFYTIMEGCTAGGWDWGELEGRVLCLACYTCFIKRGTLERAEKAPKRLSVDERRCWYEHCSPTESSHFFKIKEGCMAGGRDWGQLEGRVLCQACYYCFIRRGILERAEKAPKSLSVDERRCWYEHCSSLTESRHFYKIKEGCTAGGQDWGELEGRVLCQACYDCFIQRGTLERAEKAQKSLSVDERRCWYEHCSSPTESSHFFKIKEGCTAGGQDWGELEGRVLCHACYTCFMKRGTLERAEKAPKRLSVDERRCWYEHCSSPTKSSRFYTIMEGCTAGGWDWGELEGRVLCQACYNCFIQRGTLERAEKAQKRLSVDERRCWYEHCSSPTESSHFLKIKEGCMAGGRDWGELEGRVLCQACYDCFIKRGTLERAEKAQKGLSVDERRCWYENCSSPIESRHFLKIKEGCMAGGRDWGELEGRVLCLACYDCFINRGTLERAEKTQKGLRVDERRCWYEHCSSPTESSKFYHIKEGCTARGRDLGELEGRVLCQACYNCFINRGNLERPAQQQGLGSNGKRKRQAVHDEGPGPGGGPVRHHAQVVEGSGSVMRRAGAGRASKRGREAAASEGAVVGGRLGRGSSSGGGAKAAEMEASCARGDAERLVEAVQVADGMESDSWEGGAVAEVVVKVEEYDGTYACLICSQSVRGSDALKCCKCTCNPLHRRCIKESKYHDTCPQCSQKTLLAFAGGGAYDGGRHVEGGAEVVY